MNTATVFLDTNIFLYAAGSDHRLRAPCQALMGSLQDGKLIAATSSEVVQEILFVMFRRKLVSEGLRLAKNVLALFPNLLTVGGQEMALACDLLKSVPGIPVRDAVHAATMKNRGLFRIASIDPHFDRIAGIERLDPETFVAAM